MMFSHSILRLACLASLTLASVYSPRDSLGHKKPAPFEYLVIFGDSYTDDGLGNYFGLHADKPPPPGVLPTETAVNSGGGLVWPQFNGNYTGAMIYDYASGGATCSNEIISRFNPFMGLNIPSVIDDQIPKFQSDTDTNLFKHVTPVNAIYALWIGTNDLGTDAFLTDSQAPGTNLTTYIDCIWSVFDQIYESGGRRFVLLNNNALQLTPSYQTLENGGDYNSLYPNKTETNQKMLEYTAVTNRMMDYGVPFNLIVKQRWPHASFAVYNVHDLIVDIYNNPEEYLESPYNVKQYYNECPSTGCPADHNLNGFLWYDSLHPTNKTGQSPSSTSYYSLLWLIITSQIQLLLKSSSRWLKVNQNMELSGTHESLEIEMKME